MGFIRSSLLFILASTLFMALIIGNIILTLSMSLQYDNVKPELGSLVNEFVSDSANDFLRQSGMTDSEVNLTKEIDDNLAVMDEYCQQRNIDEKYVFSYQSHTFEVSCDKISQGSSAIINESVGSIVDSIYYKNYECEMWSCLSQGEPYVMISEQAQQYWHAKYYIVLVIALALAVLSFIVTEKKKNFPILLGVLMIVSSLPFVKAKALVVSLSNSTYGGIANIFISQAPRVFWFMFIPGLIFILGGVAFHTVGLGTKLGQWLDKKQQEAKQSKNVKKE